MLRLVEEICLHLLYALLVYLLGSRREGDRAEWLVLFRHRAAKVP